MEENQMVILKQLPEIEIRINNISEKIKEQMQGISELIVSEDNVKDIKKIRADFNKEFQQLETERKSIKKAINSKYEEFEKIYNEKIKNLYEKADESLKEKITEIEKQLKCQKEEEVIYYFRELRQHLDLQWVEFDMLNINITLSSSIKSLKNQVEIKLNDILKDIELIELEEFKNEILQEYMLNRDFAKSKMTVIQRKQQLKEIAEMQKIKEEKQKQEKEHIEEINQQLEEIGIPTSEPTEELNTIDDEDIYIVDFKVTATKTQLKSLKLFMQENNIKYENI